MHMCKQERGTIAGIKERREDDWADYFADECSLRWNRSVANHRSVASVVALTSSYGFACTRAFLSSVNDLGVSCVSSANPSQSSTSQYYHEHIATYLRKKKK